MSIQGGFTSIIGSKLGNHQGQPAYFRHITQNTLSQPSVVSPIYCGRCLLPAHTWPEDRPSRFLELKLGVEGEEGDQEEQDIFKDEVESTGDEVVCVDEEEVKCMQEDEVGTLTLSGSLKRNNTFKHSMR